MAASGPIIEELPDDYDVHAEKAPKAPGVSARGASGSGPAIRKGFFNQPRVVSTPSSGTGAKGTAAKGPAVDGTAANGTSSPVTIPEPTKEAPTAVPATEVGVETDEKREAEEANLVELPNPSEVVEGLRRRLQATVKTLAAQHDEAGIAQGIQEVQKSLAAIERWPTPSARTSWEKTTREINMALAEMRVSSNDTRRVRSDEKRAMTDLRRAADDALERLRKVSEMAVPDTALKDQTSAIVAAFHKLPITAKLHILARERVGWFVLMCSFFTGVLLMLGVVFEVYMSWSFSYRCQR